MASLDSVRLTILIGGAPVPAKWRLRVLGLFARLLRVRVTVAT